MIVYSVSTFQSWGEVVIIVEVQGQSRLLSAFGRLSEFF